MDIQSSTILEMVDRIVESNDEQELHSNLDGIRRTLRGNVPSVVLKQLFVSQSNPSLRRMLDANHTDQQQKINTLMRENAELEEQVKALTSHYRAFTHAVETPIDDYYSFGFFMLKLTVKLGRSYGWRTDLITASQNTPSVERINNQMIQTWRKEQRVPVWVIEQIDRLNFPARVGGSGHLWNDENEGYMVDQILQEPRLPNAELARRCTDEFGWPVNENMVKGKRYRAQKNRRLPNRRRPAAK